MDELRESTTTSTLSTQLITTTTMAALISATESRIVYVWAPYSIFLLIIFIVLAVSFVKHTRRVLKRRRIMLDYMEANVLCKRPRIVRMFTSSLNRGLPLDLQNVSPRDGPCPSRSSSLAALRSPGYYRRPSAGSYGSLGLHPALRDSHGYLQVPGLGLIRSDGRRYGLEDSGQSAWFHNGTLRGQHNLAFSFDEEFGRSHFKRFIPEGWPGLDARDLESRMNCCSTQTSPLHSSRPSLDHHQTDLGNPRATSLPGQRREGRRPPHSHPASTCSHCGHDLSGVTEAVTSIAGPHVARTSQLDAPVVVHEVKDRPRPNLRVKSDSFTAPSSRRTDSAVVPSTRRLSSAADSLRSSSGRVSKAFSRTKSDSESTATTVMTQDSGTTVTGNSGRQKGKIQRAPNIDQMLSGMEVYTIPTGEATLDSAHGHPETMAPHSGAGDLRETTSPSDTRQQSAFLPLVTMPQRTLPSTTTQLQPLPRPRSSTLRPQTAGSSAATSASLENSIFWLANSENLQQTLV